jgi:hypothetical protein
MSVMASIIFFITHFLWLRSFAAAQAFPVAGLIANCLTRSFYETKPRVCHSKFAKIFLKRNKGKNIFLMDAD